MGVVLLAEDERLARRVAIKVLSAQASGNAETRTRFLREARAMAAVEHPHIVRVYQFGETEGSAYIVMEYIEGETLGQLLQRKGRLSIEEALHIATQVVKGLEAALSRGLIHRDVKPSNVLIDGAGGAHVSDFGLAKSVTLDSEPGITSTGAILGTPYYISPEQGRAEPVDFRSDIYSLGILLYEILTGQRPFEAASAFEIVSRHVREAVPPLLDKRSDTPPSLARLVAQMTRKDPADRPGSYQELLQSLAECSSPPPTATLAERARGRQDGQRLRLWASRLVVPLGFALLIASVFGVLTWRNTRSTDSVGRTISLDFADFSRDYWQRELGRRPEIGSFDHSHGDLQDFFRYVADVTGLNVIVAPGIAGKVVGRYHDLPWPELLTAELREQGLEWFYTKNVIFIATPQALKQLWGTDLLLFGAPPAAAKDVLATVSPFLSRSGSYASANLNSTTAGVVVADLPLQIDYVAGVLERLGLVGSFEQITLNRILCADPTIPASPNPLHVRFRFGTPTDKARDMSIDWKDQDFREGISEVAREAGFSIRFQKGISGRMNAKLTDVPAGAVLSHVLGLNQLEYSCDGQILNAFTRSTADNYGGSRVFPISAPTKAKDLTSALETTLLGQGDTLEALPAGNALRFVGRSSVGRRLALALQCFSALASQ